MAKSSKRQEFFPACLCNLCKKRDVGFRGRIRGRTNSHVL